ncbi:uncharacterized protein F4822DRAFT_77193 [Hypoxylon trugodes]|uniref:uncharacterized protein n=1 Tax=Hypoxylon trugodes TaxID=326681 RepID=UPI002194006A|nr:uncharacterized protein F4822DRAFT_77193 [Hypoxylon trugodes]KAI1383420.1 hypothetical protein F4822DRAFT_77193 [Hypoxylon trugodes]
MSLELSDSAWGCPPIACPRHGLGMQVAVHNFSLRRRLAEGRVAITKTGRKMVKSEYFQLHTSTSNESYLSLQRSRCQTQRTWGGIVLACLTISARHLECSDDLVEIWNWSRKTIYKRWRGCRESIIEWDLVGVWECARRASMMAFRRNSLLYKCIFWGYPAHTQSTTRRVGYGPLVGEIPKGIGHCPTKNDNIWTAISNFSLLCRPPLSGSPAHSREVAEVRGKTYPSFRYSFHILNSTICNV